MPTDPLKNPVGFLQEFCMKHGNSALPKYIDLGGSGADHCKEFTCQCLYDGHEVTATGCQKKQAKFEAALKMYLLLEGKEYFAKLGFKVDQSSNANFSGKFKSEPADFSRKNPIALLQEHCQSNRYALPNYFDSSIGNNFYCECSVLDNKTFGNGPSKKCAKTYAANNMCVKLGLLGCEQPENLALRPEEKCTGDKNAISALNELCDVSSLPKPVYQDRGLIDNLFEFVCQVGTVVGEGRYLTKKGAKLLAAKKVLGQLNQHCEFIESKEKTLVDTRLTSKLEEFSLSSDEEDKTKDDNSAVSVKLEPGISKTLESLSLDDSVIEVEPRNLAAEVLDHQDIPGEAMHNNMKKGRQFENEHQDGHPHNQKTPTSETLLKWATKDQVGLHKK